MKSISFTPPPNLELPEGTKEGDTVEFMSEYRVEGSGKLCLVGIEGHETGGSEDSEQPKGDEFVDRYKSAMAES